MTTILNMLMSMFSGGSTTNSSGASSLLNMLLSMLGGGGSSSSTSGSASSLINQLLAMLSGGSSSSSGSGSYTGGGTTTGTTQSNGNPQGIPVVSLPYSQDFSSQTLNGVYSQGHYTNLNQGWGLLTGSTSSGSTVDLAGLGGGAGYPSDCSTGNNSQDPEILIIGAFDFSSYNGSPTISYEAAYNTQNTDGGIFIVYDLNTGNMDTPDPIAGNYEVGLSGGTGGANVGQGDQTMQFDLSSYVGSADQYMLGIYFQSQGNAGGTTSGYWACTNVVVQ
jgi:hypothetical protein